MVKINAHERFTTIARKLIPTGQESEYHKHLPEGVTFDEKGNAWLYIPAPEKQKVHTIFTAHMDTVSKELKEIEIVSDGRYLSSNDNTIVGADDKAGIVCLEALILNKVPGLYYFFVEEEGGGRGSAYAAEKMYKKHEDSPVVKHNLDIKHVISFDRYGTNSIISKQSGGICCSDEFVRALSDEFANKGGLFMEDDTGGTFTDSAYFMELVSECTNISVGYYDQHTVHEAQDIIYLQRLCEVLPLISWHELPASRTPKEKSYRSIINKDKPKTKAKTTTYYPRGNTYYDGGWGGWYYDDEDRDYWATPHSNGWDSKKQTKYSNDWKEIPDHVIDRFDTLYDEITTGYNRLVHPICVMYDEMILADFTKKNQELFTIASEDKDDEEYAKFTDVKNVVNIIEELSLGLTISQKDAEFLSDKAKEYFDTTTAYLIQKYVRDGSIITPIDSGTDIVEETKKKDKIITSFAHVPMPNLTTAMAHFSKQIQYKGKDYDMSLCKIVQNIKYHLINEYPDEDLSTILSNLDYLISYKEEKSDDLVDIVFNMLSELALWSEEGYSLVYFYIDKIIPEIDKQNKLRDMLNEYHKDWLDFANVELKEFSTTNSKEDEESQATENETKSSVTLKEVTND